MNPREIPCRVCQAGPGEPCKYKGTPIDRSLGGHARKTPRRLRIYHYKRVDDVQRVLAAAKTVRNR